MKHSFYFAVMLFIGANCTSEDSLDAKKTVNVDMRFIVNGEEKIVTAEFIYSSAEKRYVLNSDAIEEIMAKDKVTGKVVYVYNLISSDKEIITDPTAKFDIKRGYYGYSSEAGCFYYGTLYVGDNGESLFVADTGIYSILNPPHCDVWIC